MMLNSPPTRIWLIRHALVSAQAREALYGRRDVPLCTETLTAQADTYRMLAERLPSDAAWYVSPLSRTRLTALAIQDAGGISRPLTVEDGLIEQDMGGWQGLPHAELPALLTDPAHAFWPIAADEIPPDGESMAQVVTRVGDAIEKLAAANFGRDVVAVSHGGAIRAAIAHAMGCPPGAVLHLSIYNLSLTMLERFARGWRVACVNDHAHTSATEF